MPNPLVSVALAACNGAKFISAQIKSVLAQSYAPLEFVVVDDASTDETAAILRDYAARDARVQVHFNERNLGYNANFVRALSLCRGEYVAPCDQDDIWHPDKLSLLRGAIGLADLAYCDSEYVDGTGASLGRRVSSERGMYAGSDPLAFVLTNSVSGHASLCRRRLVELACPFPEDVYYDWWLALNAAAGQGVRYLDRPLVQCRRHGNTVSTLGGTGHGRKSASMREYLTETRRLVSAMRRLDGCRKADIEALDAALQAWLENGRQLPFLKFVWLHSAVMLQIARPRLPSIALRMFRDFSLLNRSG